MPRHAVLVLTAISALLTACSDLTSPRPHVATPRASVDTWACYDPTDPHCSHTPPPGDPNPANPGYWLGAEVAGDMCIETGNDADFDRLDDFCEYQLALAFRPALSIDPNDGDSSREPYWAAKTSYDVNGNIVVNIMYMFGYHWDAGDTGCFPPPPPGFPGCGAHLGDSEFVDVEIHWSNFSDHWELTRMFMAAHYGESTDASALYTASQLELARPGGYAKVYVARDKHGSYNTRSHCDSGAFWNDTCDYNTDAGRFNVLEYRNVGSSRAPMIQSIGSDQPSIYGGTEYFWSTGFPFCGWDTQSTLQNNRGGCATSYAALLGAFAY